MVARRAVAIDTEYMMKASALDRQRAPLAPNGAGSIENKLRNFGGVRGVVFGAWAEASSDVEWLLLNVADFACMG